MKKYVIGYTIKNNMPCILVDGDSVFVIFPNEPHGMKHAEAVCNLLNATTKVEEMP